MTSDKRLVRLAAVAAGLGHLPHDWYSGMILHGIDEASVDDAITVELLGDHHAKPGALARRLVHSRPDVFACIGPPMAHTSVIGEAGRLGIPCILAGNRAPEVGLPNIFEDSVAASAIAVTHLAEAGHCRIGFVQIAMRAGGRSTVMRDTCAGWTNAASNPMRVWCCGCPPNRRPRVFRPSGAT